MKDTVRLSPFQCSKFIVLIQSEFCSQSVGKFGFFYPLPFWTGSSESEDDDASNPDMDSESVQCLFVWC